MMIEADLEDLQQTNSPFDIFTRFVNYFQMNFYETSLLFNAGELMILGSRDKNSDGKFFRE